MTDLARASSIKVAVRVRPFNNKESINLIPQNNGNETGNDRYIGNGIFKLVDCIDDKMLIFDPIRNPLNILQSNTLNSLYSQRIRSRRSIKFNQIYEDDEISDDSQEIKFVFDKLFDENASQEEIYEDTTSSLIDSVIEGYNATVFAYGATGCGKTYTISGTPDEPGIIFQAMQDLFQRIEQLTDEQEFKISISFLEIYNERIRDLLKPETNYKKLVIREDDNHHTTVANLSHHYPENVQEVIDLVIRGNINRTTSATEANEVSSRSHAVLQVHVIQTNKKIDFITDQKYATLSIIDLAGSERAASTKNRGQRLHEGANINRSLLALGNCINALCIEEAHNSKRINHIPYRDSKLTRLLKFSLGGNCKTVMIVCVSPSSSHYDETLNTLKYANRAKEIKTKIIKNQQTLNKHVGSYLKMINEQKLEIERLRKREASMIEIRLKKFKLNYSRIELKMEKVMNNIIDQYTNNPRFQEIKFERSVTLVKRRFLQLIKIEIDNIMKYITDYTDLQIINTATMIQTQLIKGIQTLENKFDTQDELDM
ncbi:kinesin-like protein Klp5, partial [Maudiozyma exigua]